MGERREASTAAIGTEGPERHLPGDAGRTVDHPAETRPPEERRAGFLELFFDLVFVFAVTQVATLLVADTSAGGFARSALVLALVWWTWSQYTWTTNAVDPARPAVRATILAAAAGIFFVAQAIPDAFGDGGRWFGVAYLVVRLVGLALYWLGLREAPDHQAALRTFVPLASIAPALVLVGALVDQPARQWIWLLALVVDVAGAVNAGKGAFQVSAAHFAERHGLFVIIALGEAIIAVGLTTAGLERTPLLAATILVLLGITGLLWWSYFGWVGQAAEHRLRRTPGPERGRLARDLYTFLHAPIVAGVVAFAVGAKKVVAHPDDPLSAAGRAALGLGIVLFLAGFVLGNLRATGRLLPERLAALAVVALACATLGAVDAVWLALTCLVVLAAALAAEHRRRTRHA